MDGMGDQTVLAKADTTLGVKMGKMCACRRAARQRAVEGYRRSSTLTSVLKTF